MPNSKWQVWKISEDEWEYNPTEKMGRDYGLSKANLTQAGRKKKTTRTIEIQRAHTETRTGCFLEYARNYGNRTLHNRNSENSPLQKWILLSSHCMYNSITNKKAPFPRLFVKQYKRATPHLPKFASIVKKKLCTHRNTYIKSKRVLPFFILHD